MSNDSRKAAFTAEFQMTDTLWAAVFLAPALIIFSVVIIYPMFYSAWLSLFEWDGVAPTKLFVGLDNYTTLLTSNRVFWIALKNSILWTVVALTVPTSLGLALALVLNRKFAGRAFFRSVFYFPAILSMSIVGLIWTWVYHPTLGMLNQLLGWLGQPSLQHAWLSEPSIALFCVMIAAAWHNTGLPMLLFLAGLQTIPPDVLEEARRLLPGFTLVELSRNTDATGRHERPLVLVRAKVRTLVSDHARVSQAAADLPRADQHRPAGP